MGLVVLTTMSNVPGCSLLVSSQPSPRAVDRGGKRGRGWEANVAGIADGIEARPPQIAGGVAGEVDGDAWRVRIHMHDRVVGRIHFEDWTDLVRPTAPDKQTAKGWVKGVRMVSPIFADVVSGENACRPMGQPTLTVWVAAAADELAVAVDDCCVVD